jgi:AraC family transcriptional regulator, regulatory protein of adaptative response / methylated-DNA-[protein]-cysteine methyltransferase
MVYITEIDTPIGLIEAGASGKGIVFIKFGDESGSFGKTGERAKYPYDKISRETNDHLSTLKREMKGYFDGSLREFRVALDINGTEFQRRVWNNLVSIPYGRTISYLKLAENMGNTKTIRAIAGANAVNRIPIIIPCHRVIGEDGSLTGYAGGLWRKEWLLDHERKHSGKPFGLNLFSEVRSSQK